MVSRMIAIVSVMLLAPALQAKTWIVAADGSGDFTSIQAAVDAAKDGDVIVVRAGVYAPFDIKKKTLCVVGSGIDNTIVDAGDQVDQACDLYSLDADRIMIGHMTLKSYECARTYYLPKGISVWCDVKLHRTVNYQWVTGNGCALADGQHLLCRTFMYDEYPPGTLPAWSAADGAIVLSNLTVLSQGYFIGYQGDNGEPGTPPRNGGSGVGVDSCEIYLAEVSGLGSLGGKAWVGGPYCDDHWDAANGGSGLALSTNTTALVATRDPSMFFQGGQGGSGGPTDDCGRPTFRGGDGGDGVRVLDSSSAILSGPMQLVAGPRGNGNPPGNYGKDKSGNVTVLSRWLPTLTIDGTGAIGSRIDLTVHGDPGDRVILLSSDRFAKTPVPGATGFPLFASPGGTYFVAVSSGILSGSDLRISFPIALDPNLIGRLVLFQAVVIPRDAALAPALTNVVAEIVRDQ